MGFPSIWFNWKILYLIFCQENMLRKCQMHKVLVFSHWTCLITMLCSDVHVSIPAHSQGLKNMVHRGCRWAKSLWVLRCFYGAMHTKVGHAWSCIFMQKCWTVSSYVCAVWGIAILRLKFLIPYQNNLLVTGYLETLF